MTKTAILIIIFLVLGSASFLFTKSIVNIDKVIVKPEAENSVLQKPTPLPSPNSTPFKIDPGINLSEELETVDPGILETDFSELESLINKF